MAHYTGENYESSRDIKDIAKAVRKDIKAAVKSGQLPKVKVSVRISRYSMGQSLTVEITETSYPIVTPAFVKALSEDSFAPNRTTPIAGRVLDAITDIVNAYNYNKSDSMTDYYDVNFYAHVKYDADLRRDHMDKIKAHMGVN